MDTLWKVLAICGGVVIGTVIVVLWIWYRTRYRKKRSSMPKIVVSNEQFFEKTGNFIIEKLGEKVYSFASNSICTTMYKQGKYCFTATAF